MKYLAFSVSGDPALRLGVLHGDVVQEVKPYSTLLALIEAGPSAWKEMAERYARAAPGAALDVRDIRWHAPIPRPRKNIFCVGRNYISHVEEMAAARGQAVTLPAVPVFFTKAPTTVNGPYDAVPWDRTATQQLDYEAELGVIIGIAGRNIARERALAHVFGYTAINDVTGRDTQVAHTQWFKGKSLDGSCPMGPCVVTADEFGDPQAKRVSFRLNGELRQDATTRAMIFPVAVTIEWLSRGLTLQPGDVIATGTPEGVGHARTPPQYMQDGDMMETEVEGIGTMRNRVAAVG